jgi:hypothetical protein
MASTPFHIWLPLCSYIILWNRNLTRTFCFFSRCFPCILTIKTFVPGKVSRTFFLDTSQPTSPSSFSPYPALCSSCCSSHLSATPIYQVLSCFQQAVLSGSRVSHTKVFLPSPSSLTFHHWGEIPTYLSNLRFKIISGTLYPRAPHPHINTDPSQVDSPFITFKICDYLFLIHLLW